MTAYLNCLCGWVGQSRVELRKMREAMIFFEERLLAMEEYLGMQSGIRPLILPYGICGGPGTAVIRIQDGVRWREHYDRVSWFLKDLMLKLTTSRMMIMLTTTSPRSTSSPMLSRLVTLKVRLTMSREMPRTSSLRWSMESNQLCTQPWRRLHLPILMLLM